MMWSGRLLGCAVVCGAGCLEGFVGCAEFLVAWTSLEDPLRLADSAPPPSATGEGMRAGLCVGDALCVVR